MEEAEVQDLLVDFDPSAGFGLLDKPDPVDGLDILDDSEILGEVDFPDRYCPTRPLADEVAHEIEAAHFWVKIDFFEVWDWLAGSSTLGETPAWIPVLQALRLEKLSARETWLVGEVR